MRFTCNRALLAEVASLVGQAVASKSTKKVFECVRLIAGAGYVELSGTDLEVAMRSRVDADVQTEGQAVVPASLFSGVLREIGDDTISIEVDRQKMVIDTDGGRFELEGEDPAQFPEIHEFPPEITGTMAPEDLKTLSRKTCFAAGKEAARFVLNGVRLIVAGKTIRAVATDGRRLATVARPLDGASVEISAIVGVKGMLHFEKVAAAAEGPVEVAVAERFVSVRSGTSVATARTLEGTFPDHNEIVPKETPLRAQAPVGMLAARVRQASQFTSVESQSVVVSLAPGEMSIAASGGDGRAQVRLSVEYDGPEEKIGFNPAYLLDALKVIDGETVSFGMTDRHAAATLKDGSGFVYVLMPVIVD